MKNLRKAIIICLFFILVFGNTVFADEPKISVIIEDSLLEFDFEPIVAETYIYLPIRDIAEAMGYKVLWDKDTNIIVLTKVGSYIELKNGDRSINANGKTVTLALRARLSGDNVFVPLSFFTDCLNMFVYKDAKFLEDGSLGIWITAERLYNQTNEMEYLEKTKNYQTIGAVDKSGVKKVIKYYLKDGGETLKSIEIGDNFNDVLKAYGIEKDYSYDFLTLNFLYEPGGKNSAGSITFYSENGRVSKVVVVPSA